jgi:hypothetical protein
MLYNFFQQVSGYNIGQDMVYNDWSSSRFFSVSQVNSNLHQICFLPTPLQFINHSIIRPHTELCVEASLIYEENNQTALTQ